MTYERLDFGGWARILLGLALPIALGGAVQAEGQCGNEDCVYIVVDVNSLVEDPDPLLMWEDFTDGLGHPLNPGGEARGDGPADLVLDPFTGVPQVVWAYNIGSSFEVAFTQWSHDGWLPVEFLTANGWDDVDPQIAIGPDGTGYVVWWYIPGTAPEIHMSRRSARTGGFEVPYLIATNGRRPSVIVGSDNTLFVAFERPLGAGRQQVVAIRRAPGQPPIQEVIATVPRVQPLEVQLEQDGGVVWMHWRHTDRLAGYTEFRDGAWGVSPGSFLGGGSSSSGFADIELMPPP